MGQVYNPKVRRLKTIIHESLCQCAITTVNVYYWRFEVLLAWAHSSSQVVNGLCTCGFFLYRCVYACLLQDMVYLPQEGWVWFLSWRCSCHSAGFWVAPVPWGTPSPWLTHTALSGEREKEKQRERVHYRGKYIKVFALDWNLSIEKCPIAANTHTLIAFLVVKYLCRTYLTGSKADLSCQFSDVLWGLTASHLDIWGNWISGGQGEVANIPRFPYGLTTRNTTWRAGKMCRLASSGWKGLPANTQKLHSLIIIARQKNLRYLFKVLMKILPH